MGAKRGIRKGDLRKDKFLDRPYHDYTSGRGQRLANYALVKLRKPQASDRGFVLTISSETGIPVTTLKNWRRKIRLNAKWTPWNNEKGLHSRIFTDFEECAIVDFIRANVLATKQIFTDADFQELAIHTYLSVHRLDERFQMFECSPGFVSDFKARHHFSSRRCHYKRRPTTTDAQRNFWLQEIAKVFNDNKNHDRIINCDETSWQLWPNGLLTWAETGTDCVQAQINGNEKQSLTVLAAISASGIKFPLEFLAKGKTSRVETSQLGEVGEHWVDHSENGWQNSQTFENWLCKLKDHLGPGRIDLMLDCYSAHRTISVKTLAKKLGINLHFIPPGLTDEFQPLDRCVFGSLKAMAKKLFHDRYLENPYRRRTTVDAVEDMIAAWSHLGSAVIEDAWDLYN